MKPFTLNHVVVQQLVFTSSFTCVHVRVKNAKVESSLYSITLGLLTEIFFQSSR